MAIVSERKVWARRAWRIRAGPMDWATVALGGLALLATLAALWLGWM